MPCRAAFFIERRAHRITCIESQGRGTCQPVLRGSGRGWAMVCLWRQSGTFLVRSPAAFATVVATMASKLEAEGINATIMGEDALELSGSEEDPIIQARRQDRVASRHLPGRFWRRDGPLVLYNGGILKFSETDAGVLVHYTLRAEPALNWPAIFVLAFSALALLAAHPPTGRMFGGIIFVLAFLYGLAALNSHWRVPAFFSRLAQEIEKTGDTGMAGPQLPAVG